MTAYKSSFVKGIVRVLSMNILQIIIDEVVGEVGVDNAFFADIN